MKKGFTAQTTTSEINSDFQRVIGEVICHTKFGCDGLTILFCDVYKLVTMKNLVCDKMSTYK
jgi:hypothetical protein